MTPDLYKRLKPYFVIAAAEAKRSPCIRRQYGAVIAYPSGVTDFGHITTGFNDRIGKCCHNNECVRDRLDVKHGQAVEKGGEIHAETAALINNGKRNGEISYFVLAGFSGERQLYGNESLPCHSCAMQIKYAGFDYVHILLGPELMRTLSVSGIIEYREAEWDSVE